MVNLEQYRIFYYVASLSSITKAAARLYISQPAVTKAIHRLEAELNCTLFTRTPRGTMLTEEGTLLFYHVSKALKEIEQGEEKVTQPDTTDHQQIRIGVTESALYSILMPAISSYRKAHPNTDFQIKISSTGTVLQLLEGQEVDLAFGVTPVVGYPFINITELCEVQDIFFAHRDFPVDDSIPLSPQLICTLPLVGVGSESSAGKHILDYFRRAGLYYSPAFTVETSSNVIPFVENSLAIALAPRWVYANSARRNEMRVLNTAFSIPPRKIFLAFSDRHKLSPACRDFIQMTQDQQASSVVKMP